MPPNAALDEGWAELQQARWKPALEFFRNALSDAESAEAFEGLSWAAWWLDDADVVFEARERAYRLYRVDGDAPGAARMATWLASDQLDFRGGVAVAKGWLARAHRLLDPLPPGPEHGWLSFLEGFLAHTAGETERATELARHASELGRRLEVPDLEMLGMGLEGAALVTSAQVEEGMRRLDEATATALEGDAEIPISRAWACCFLVTACSRVQDYERAAEWCDRIYEFSERFGSRYMLAFCRAGYGQVHLWRGDWSEAESLLAGSVDDFSRSRPAMAGPPLTALAELRRRQGRAREAVQLLERAGASQGAQLCRARIALDQGEARRAAEIAERLLRNLPNAVSSDRVPCLELLVRARIARGELEQAESSLRELRGIERRLGTDPTRAGADLAEGRLAGARGDHERARVLIEDAIDRFERSGGRFEAAQARVELATSLLALGRTEAAEREVARSLERLGELGAEPEARRAQRLLDSSSAETPLSELTPRERQVLSLLAEGLTNAQIAERLVVSEHTVHRHVTNLLRKLDLPSRTAAAVHAARAGLLDGPAA